MDEPDFSRFKFKMSFGRMSYIAQHPWIQILTQNTHTTVSFVLNNFRPIMNIFSNPFTPFSRIYQTIYLFDLCRECMFSVYLPQF